MRKTKKLCSMLLALSLVFGQGPMMEAKAAESEDLTFVYETIGNTGATIQITSGQEVTATVEDSTIATATVNGDIITVTGVEGAEGIAEVALSYGTAKACVVEVPIGYTTFKFDEENLYVYEGSGKYEINMMSFANQTSEDDVAGTDQEDGSILFSNTEDTKINIDIKKKGGTYVFTGKGNDMSITVKKEATGPSELLLAGLDLSASYTAPIVVKKNSTTTATITALEGHINTLTDAELNNADIYGDTEEDGGDGTNVEFAESACIKAKTAAQLTLNGEGTLKLNCASKNAVKVGESGTLTIEDISLDITSTGHGVSSDNILTVNSGNISIDSASDAMRSDPDAVDATAGCSGVINITGGNFDIKAGADGIQAAQDLNISGGDFDIQTGAGYNDSAFNKDTMSCKGLKASFNTDDTETTDTAVATNTIEITGGTFALNTADDAVHSDAYIVITGGEFNIKTGDDGVHADTSLTLGTEGGADADASITVETCYEGLEGGCVYVYSGTYSVTGSDDGINAAGDANETNTGSTSDNFNPGGGPGRPGQMGGGAGMITAGCNINIAGGRTYVNVNGDGLDANDSLNITGGNVVVFGAAAGSDNQPLDCDGTITIDGGTVFAAGSSGMAVSISGSQSYVTYGSASMGGGMGRPGQMGTSGSTISAGQTINVKNNGTTVFNIVSPKNVNYVLYSSLDVTTSGWTIDADSSEVIEDPCRNGHDYDDGVVTTAATCAKEGVKTYSCKNCDATKTESIAKTEHSFKNYVSNNDATTEADGTKTAKCENCTATDTIIDVGSKLPQENSGDNNAGDNNSNNNTDSGNTENTGNTSGEQTEEILVDTTPGALHKDEKTGIGYKILTNTDGKKTVSCVGIENKADCKKLVIPATVIIAEEKYTVTEIADAAFKNAKKLTNVTIGKNITKIGKNAFANCKSLKKILVKSTKIKKVGNKAISSIHKKAAIKVPKKKLAAYKKLFGKKAGYKKSMKITK